MHKKHFPGTGSGLADELMKLSNRRVPPDHREFLDLAVQAVGGGDAVYGPVAGLWLRDWHKNQMLLDLCSPSGLENGPGGAGLISLAVPVPGLVEAPGYHAHALRAIEGEGPFRTLARARGNRKLCSFALVDSSHVEKGGEERLVGFLQLWTDRELSAEEDRFLRSVATCMATNLFRSRSRRELESLKQLLKHSQQSPANLDVPHLFQGLAEVMVKVTCADYAIVFSPRPDQLLTGVVAWGRESGRILNPDQFVAGPGSLIRSLFEQPTRIVRLANFCDGQERQAAFNIMRYDEKLRQALEKRMGVPQGTWMAAPILSHDQVLGILVLMNKSRNLPRQFSATDQEILDQACHYVGSLLPSIQARRLMDVSGKQDAGALAELQATGPSQQQPKIHVPSPGLFEALQQCVPNVTSAAIRVAHREGGKFGAMTFHLGGNEFLADHPDYLSQPTKGVQLMPEIPEQPGLVARFSMEVPGLRESVAHLGVTLSSQRLSDQEQAMLELFTRTVLTNQLRAREITDANLRIIMEIRHNIRAGLNGLGHLGVAMDLFEVARRQQYKVPAPIIQKAFKAVRRAHRYAEQTRVLMEQTKFILTEISSENLRPEKQRLGDIVREVMLALSIEAEEYRVDLHLDDRIPRNEEVEVDRGLLYILCFNLVENAIKYTTDHHSVQIRTYLQERHWHLEVENQGPLMDLQTRIDIFQPFVRRFNDQLRKARPGTGLGLPSVQRIARAHKGTCDATSDPLSQREGAKPLARNVFSVHAPRWLQ